MRTTGKAAATALHHRRTQPLAAFARGDDWVMVPLRLQSEMNTREHWGVRNARREAQQLATAAALTHLARPRLPAVVTLTRQGPRAMDSDNAVISAKHVRDQVAKWLGVDDGDEARVRYEYAQAKGPYGVRIEVRGGAR